MSYGNDRNEEVNSRPHFNVRVQAFSQWQEYEDLIQQETGVVCTIKVRPNSIGIRTRDLADFYLAKSVIKGRTSKEIVRDVLGEKEPSTGNTF